MQSFVVNSPEKALEMAERWNGVMVKSLWSCSGRGVFLLNAKAGQNECRRLHKLIQAQGGVEIEPFYSSLCNFALEFEALSDGTVRFMGLSVFCTSPLGAYSANWVAPASRLQQKLQQLGGPSRKEMELLACVCEKELSRWIAGTYAGPLGVDMMMVENGALPCIHPCIEVNLRRTMGHMACSMAQRKLKLEDLPQIFHKLCYICND